MHSTFGHIFGKSRPICKTISPYTWGNFVHKYR